MKKKILFLLLILLIFIFFSVFFWLYEAKYFVGRASVSQASFSVDNSYIFFTPLRAKANGNEKIRVTVFVLNDQGLGVLGKKVVLSSDINLKIEAVQPQTDQHGKAFFDVAASQAGEYFLEVKVDETTLPQKAHLSFY